MFIINCVCKGKADPCFCITTVQKQAQVIAEGYTIYISVNNGEYISAVCDRNLAENISRVLYPNDNVSSI